MLTQPIQAEMHEAKRVLISGAGGGFDFLCGLPLLLALEAEGKQVFLANLSFTALQTVRDGTWLSDSVLEVNSRSHGPDYFPEGWLAKWFGVGGSERPIYCFQARGGAPLIRDYQLLADHLNIDTVILVDGGVDSLLRGDEHSLGTPLWDALSVGAVEELDVPRKFLATTAFGAERWDKISHAQAFARIADLTRDDALLGVATLLRSTREGRAFIDAAKYIFEHQKKRPSIVVSSMLSALAGEFGERSVNSNTESTPLWVSPLMCLYWFFDANEVARHKRFLTALKTTETLGDAADRMHEWSERHVNAPWESIPI